MLYHIRENAGPVERATAEHLNYEFETAHEFARNIFNDLRDNPGKVITTRSPSADVRLGEVVLALKGWGICILRNDGEKVTVCL